MDEPGPAAAATGLTIIGTGHVFRIAAAVRAAVQAIGPDVVFVELDAGRYRALRERQRGSSPPKGGGLVHRRLQAFQEGVAGMYGAQVGEEMLAAVDGARDVGARVELVDPSAEDTLRRALQALTWRERLRAVGLLAKGAASQLLPRRRGARQRIEEEIRSYQEDPEAALVELERQFPTLHRVVIAERDERMAAAVRRALAAGGHGVLVVGDGHVPGLLRHLRDLAPQVYRLPDARSGRLPRPLEARGTPERLSFRVTLPPHA